MKSHKKKLSPVFITAILSFLLFFFSCASVEQNLRIAPIDRSYPISASSAILSDSNILQKSDLEIIKEFNFTKVYSAKFSEKDVILDLSKELDDIVRLTGADGISGLKITVKNIDAGATNLISLEKYLGIFGTGLGIGWLIMSLSTSPSSYPEADQANLIASITVTGAGALFLGISYWHESAATVGYVIEVQGNAVKFKKP
ncbi:MAG: hypothetical protein JW969_06115 [Spirochaetales bacterium]|nr:hypothetical protein [Spirochaetales bacterium]